VDKFRLLHFPWAEPERLGLHSYLGHTHTLFCNAFLCDMFLCGMLRCDFCCGHCFSPFSFLRRTCATHNSHLTISKISTNSSSYIRLTKPIFTHPQQSIRLIYFRLFTQVPPKKCVQKNKHFGEIPHILQIFTHFYPYFQPIRAFSLKSPLLILAIHPILTHIWCASIGKSPCKCSISPISTGLKLGISPETHLQIPVLSLIGARHLPPAEPVL